MPVIIVKARQGVIKGKAKKANTGRGRKGAAAAAPALPGFNDDDEEG